MLAARSVLRVASRRGGSLRQLSTSTSSSSASSGPVSRNAAIAAAAGLGVLLLAGSVGGSGSGPDPAVQNPAAAASGAAPSVESLEARLKALEAEVAPLRAASLNRAFVFLKPHAANDKVSELVQSRLRGADVSIVGAGELSHQAIDEGKLIDTHYGAIASKAVLLKPKELNVPDKAQAGFEKMFGMPWAQALEKGLVYNAQDGAAKLGVDGEGLDKLWSKLTRGSDLIKFGGGFYCGKVGDIFVINGFYMSMRGKYTTAPAKIKYFLVEWAPESMSWEDFRGKLLGATDPATAEAGSLRREIFERWQELGLAEVPNTGDNGVHASASPFEAMAERVNWVKAPLAEDPFAKGLLAMGLSEGTIKAWMEDAQVPFLGKKQSIFDLLEDTDSAECLQKAKVINAES